MSKCIDCNEYNQEKHYCPKFCDVIRETDKEMREYYEGEHEKLEKIEKIITKYQDTLDNFYGGKPRDLLESDVLRDIKGILEEE